MVSVSPEGLQRGVQTQGTHHAPKAGTQRPQKHTGANTLVIWESGREGGGVSEAVQRLRVHVLSQQSKWMTLEKASSVSPLVCLCVRACVAHRHVKGWPLAAPLAWGSMHAMVS